MFGMKPLSRLRPPDRRVLVTRSKVGRWHVEVVTRDLYTLEEVGRRTEPDVDDVTPANDASLDPRPTTP